jgi:hypothetical protein
MCESRAPLVLLFVVLFAAVCGIDPAGTPHESLSADVVVERRSFASGAQSLTKHTPINKPTSAGTGCTADGFTPETDKYPPTLPIWGEDLVRYQGNPVIVGSDVSREHVFVADPYLLVVKCRIYMFFEALLRERVGQIWMAESTDGFSWSGFRQVSAEPIHFSHPQAFIYNGRVHLFYNHNRDGSIYYRWSPVERFPSWSQESVVFRGSKHGWHRLVEFTMFEHGGIWYLLGITENSSTLSTRLQHLLGSRAKADDQWVRGRWAGRFTTDWDRGSHEITPFPLIDVNDSGWAQEIVEITSLRVGDRLLLFMGARRQADGKRAIGTFAVTSLSPQRLEGVWLNHDFTFPLASSGWDDTDIHRAHAVAFEDRWIYVYDARKGDEWKIGIATMPLR